MQGTRAKNTNHPAHQRGLRRGPGLLGNAPVGFAGKPFNNIPVKMEGDMGTNNHRMHQPGQQQNMGIVANKMATNNSDISQMFNAARDTQLALVSTLLKGNLCAPLGNNLMAGMATETARQTNVNIGQNNMVPVSRGSNMGFNNMMQNNLNFTGTQMVANHITSRTACLSSGSQNNALQMAAPAQRQRAPVTGFASTNHRFHDNMGFQGPNVKKAKWGNGVFPARTTRWQANSNGVHSVSPYRHVSPHIHDNSSSFHVSRGQNNHHNRDSLRQDKSYNQDKHHFYNQDSWEGSDGSSQSLESQSRSQDSHEPGYDGSGLIQSKGPSPEEYDPAQPTEELPSATVKDEKSSYSGSSEDLSELFSSQTGSPSNKFYCHACSVDCRNLQNFDQHMQSPRHKAQMNEIRNLHMHKTDQQLARLKAEEHLRRIEGRDKEDYCRVCDKKFHGSFINHRKSQEHKRKERLTRRGCKLCNTGPFNQYPEYVRHIDSEPHKKNQKMSRRPRCHLCNMTFRSPKKFVLHSYTENHKKKKAELRRQDLPAAEDVEDEPEVLNELVKLDAAGTYNVDTNDQEGPPVENGQRLSSVEPDVKCSSFISKSNESLGSLSSVPDMGQLSPEVHGCNKSSCDDNIVKDLPEVNGNGSPIPAEHPPAITASVGEEYVVAVSGFMCTLCGEFYRDEQQAHIVHCASNKHRRNYQKAIEKGYGGCGVECSESTSDSAAYEVCLSVMDSDNTAFPIKTGTSNSINNCSSSSRPDCSA